MPGIMSLLVAVLVSAAPPTRVSDVQVQRNDEAFETRLGFNRGIPESNVTLDFVNETIQLNVRGAKIDRPQSKALQDDPGVRSVYTYQANPDILRTRVILKKGTRADQYRDRVDVQVAGEDVLLRLRDEFTAAAPVQTFEPPVALGEPSPEPAPQEVPAGSKVSEAEAVLQSENPAKEKNLSEAQIPVLTQTAKTEAAAASGENTLVRTGLGFAIAIALLVTLGLGVRKWVQNRALPKTNTSIRMLTQFHMGPKRSLAVVRVAGETLLIGVTDSNVTLLKTLSLIDEEIPENVPRSFEETLGRAGAGEVDFKEDQRPDDFSFKGLRDIYKSSRKSSREV